jgi:hypothetical protein
LVLALRTSRSRGDPTVIRIADDRLSVEIGDRVVAAARFSEYAAADGNGAWIVSAQPARLFSHDQTITALTLAEYLTVGHGDDDPPDLC